MTPADKKADRLLQIEALLLAHPRGLTASELAQRLGVNRSTIGRYLPSLPKHIYIDEFDGQKWKIDRQGLLVNLRLNLHEATALHLASRLLANRLDKQYPHAAAALRKIGYSLETLAPHVSSHIKIAADQMDDQHKRLDPNFNRVLETLTLAWAEQRKVSLWHRHTEFDKVYQYQFSPYFIEPYSAGNSLHVIGFREPPGEIRTFKVERIESVTLLDEFYTIPETFDVTRLLSQAWGIWYSEKEPQTVVLKFSQQVSRRVLENQWHGEEHTEIQPDGSLSWSAAIAEPLEMLPWIRGWGADVEVLEPEGLRETMFEEINKLNTVYEIKQMPLYLKLWAKYDETTQRWHPLLFHCLDSAFVAQKLWQAHLSESFKDQIAGLLNCSVDDAGSLFSYWVGLHDLGKAGPAFQRKVAQKEQELKKQGLSFPKVEPTDNAYHGYATTWILKDYFNQQGFDPFFAPQLALALGGHHGEWQTAGEINNSPYRDNHCGNQDWAKLQAEILEQLKTILQPALNFEPPKNKEDRNTLLTLLTGLTTTADWIASNEIYFPYQPHLSDLSGYVKKSRSQAKNALKKIGWGDWKAEEKPIPFNKMFPFEANQIQEIILNQTRDLKSPFLMIVEAPTGSGKTEAAFYVTDTVLQREQKSGFYIAMPTQATSNQIFSRTKKFLKQRYPGESLNFHLVHGSASLNEDQALDRFQAVSQDQPKELAHLYSASWFLPRKKTLLAPFGVGTVDQTFLAVMKSKHFYMRLFGLSHKIIIFDEVHAYDVYMNTLFKRLLHWLRVVGCSVIILSATLPPSTRAELLAAYHPQAESIPDISPRQIPFPRLSIGTAAEQKQISLGETANRTIQLDWIEHTPEVIRDTLVDYLSQGGVAAVICNRVRRSQEIYQLVKQALPDAEVILFHSRYPYYLRKNIEETILEKFSKGGSRPKKAVVIATQVIEQSLDLDFDMLISDLAPADLIIQRVGRLKRHDQSTHKPARPQKFQKNNHLFLCKPQIEQERILFGGDEYVYEKYILYRSYFVLSERFALVLPEETDPLINFVYEPSALPDIPAAFAEDVEKARQKDLNDRAESQQKAGNQLIPLSHQTLIGNLSLTIHDEHDPSSSSVIRTLTRQFLPSVQLVCIFKIGEEFFLADGNLPINFDEEPGFNQLNHYLRSVITITQPEVTRYFFSSQVPPLWKKNKVLRSHYPLILENHIFETEKFTLRLDETLGIEFIKKED